MLPLRWKPIFRAVAVRHQQGVMLSFLTEFHKMWSASQSGWLPLPPLVGRAYGCSSLGSINAWAADSDTGSLQYPRPAAEASNREVACNSSLRDLALFHESSCHSDVKYNIYILALRLTYTMYVYYIHSL